MAVQVDRCTVNGEQVIRQPGGLRLLDNQLGGRPDQRVPLSMVW
jgi:hypothetical protein